MAQKPKDILLVKDEKTGEIGVVSGLKKDGSPNLEKAQGSNKDFILFDRTGDAFDSFFKNFINQCKEPSRFGFYHIAADGAENLIGAVTEMLKEPESYRDILAPHKVDTAVYEQQVKNDVTQTQDQGQRSSSNYEPIDPSRIDWDSLQKNWGISYEALEQSGDLEKMLNFGKSNLIGITPRFGDEQFNLDARLSFRRSGDGNVRVVPHFIRSEPNLKQEFFGHTFTTEDRENLLSTGNMGRIVELQSANGWRSQAFVSIDRQTNEVVATPVNKVRIPEKIGTTELDAKERNELRAGRAIHKDITLANGKKFTATLQVNAEQRSVEFVPRSVQQVREQQQNASQNTTTQRQDGYKWTDEDGTIRPPKTLGGVELSPEQQANFKEGKAILVKDMLRDRKGEPYTAYVKFNPELGRPRYYRNDPDVVRSITPATESRTQVAVNSEGKTNEATKHQQRPLERGQTAPRSTQQQNRPKRKGLSI